ncbi:MAG TPA: DUF4241 domain-containing protein [Ktedonobacterales bacterium]
MEKPIAARAFEPDVSVITSDGNRISMQTRAIADLTVTSYRIVGCDPFECTLALPFAYRVAPGRYPMFLALADFEGADDQRVAAAMLYLSDAEPTRWEPAKPEGDGKVEGDGEESTATITVDSGLAALMDREAALFLTVKLEDDADYLEDAIEDQRGPLYTDGPEWFDITLDSSTGLNIVIFSSDWGDGVYSGYWGIDDDGNLACLVIDLGILDENDEVAE